MIDTPELDRTDFRGCLNANLRALTRAVDAVYRKHLKPYGLTESQFNILAVMAQFRELPQRDIGLWLIMERSTVSRDLRRLIEREFIRREGPTNRRQLFMTDRGLEFMETLVPVWKAAMAETTDMLGSEADQIIQLRRRL